MTPRTPALMLQGTASGVGKSLLTAALCRVYARRGLRVVPFKPQNMANNAAVAEDGGEIGRAQALQAFAAGVPCSHHMNPVLLKPQSQGRSQVIVQGYVRGSASASEYWADRSALMQPVVQSFNEISRDADLVVVEGAGSASEINLRSGDIANMGFARQLAIPVVIVADIRRGGVIASLVGTNMVLDPEDRELIQGFIINRFAGDVSLFAPGSEYIAKATAWSCLGIIPECSAARILPEEDSLCGRMQALVSDAGQQDSQNRVIIAVPRLRYASNIEDLDPLMIEPQVELLQIEAVQPIPRRADAVILTGSKSTQAELGYIKDQGWGDQIKAFVTMGGHVLGICGGYQMLGTMVTDATGIDGEIGASQGLELLDVSTHMQPEKTVTRRKLRHLATGCGISGYEMRVGVTDGTAAQQRPMFSCETSGNEGAMSPDGKVLGTSIHGVLANDHFRKWWIAHLKMDSVSDAAAVDAGFTAGVGSSVTAQSQSDGENSEYWSRISDAIDVLADQVEVSLNVEEILEIARSRVAGEG